MKTEKMKKMKLLIAAIVFFAIGCSAQYNPVAKKQLFGDTVRFMKYRNTDTTLVLSTDYLGRFVFVKKGGGYTTGTTAVINRLGIEDTTGVQNRTLLTHQYYFDVISGIPDYSGRLSELYIDNVSASLYHQENTTRYSSVIAQDTLAYLKALFNNKSTSLNITPSAAKIVQQNGSLITSKNIVRTINGVPANDTGNVEVVTGTNTTIVNAGNEIITASNGIKKIDTDFQIDGRLDSTAEISVYTGSSTILDVKDSLRGGLFRLYTGPEAPNGGIIFADGAGRKWKRDFDKQFVRPEWFGANPALADNYSYFRAACDYILTHDDTKELRVSRHVFNIGQSLIFYAPIRIVGENGLHGIDSRLLFPPNTKGIQFIETNFDYVAGMKNIAIDQGFVPSNQYRDSTAHNITIRCKVEFDNVNVPYSSGNGLDIRSGDNNVSLFGSSAGSTFRNVRVNEAYNGVYITGYESNTMLFEKLFVVGCTRYGVYDNGFLGNTYIAPQIDANGNVTRSRTVVTYGGKWYCAKNDEYTVNINHQPDISPTYWYEVGGMGATVWSPSVQYFGGGPLIFTNPNAWNLILSPYTEGFQPPIILNARSTIHNGDNGAGALGGIVEVISEGTKYQSSNLALGGGLSVGKPTPATKVGYFWQPLGYNQSQGLYVEGEGILASLSFKNSTGTEAGIAYLGNALYLGANDIGVVTIDATGFLPRDNNTFNLGDNLYKWKDVHAVTYHGSASQTTLNTTPTSDTTTYKPLVVDVNGNQRRATSWTGNPTGAPLPKLTAKNPTNGGIQRMSTSRRKAIKHPTEGTPVYDLNLHKLFVFDGKIWRKAW